MCLGSAPNPPSPPAQLPEAPQTPAPSTLKSGANADKRRKRIAAGNSGTLLTGARGIQDSTTTGPKTLLGQ